MSTPPAPPLRVLFLGPLRERLGRESAEVPCPRDGTQPLFWEVLLETFPALGPCRASVRLARDHDFLAATALLQPGDEIALVPPVSGG